ncbi:MAG: NlpC/P60 family protein [Streptosporangiaceae bacterium]
MHTAPTTRTMIRQGASAVTVAIFAAGLLMGVAGSALGSPPPTLSQAQATLTKLQSQVDKLDQQYDQVQQQLAATNQRLGVIEQEQAAYEQSFADERDEIGRIAVTAYEDGNVNASITLLTSGNPQQILNQSSILLELSATNSARIRHFLVAAKELRATQILALRTQASIVQLKDSLAAQKASMNKLVSQQETLVAQLTPAQQTLTEPGAGGSTTAKYTGPTATQAEKAVAFAYDQLGCPYVYGGSGPCGNGYDCSGLTMSAWAYAGVSIPRTSEEQWAELPHVSIADLQPGDILVFSGAGHVGLYVGNNELIDAPHTGLDVELVSFSGWYQSTLDGAVRP